MAVWRSGRMWAALWLVSFSSSCFRNARDDIDMERGERAIGAPIELMTIRKVMPCLVAIAVLPSPSKLLVECLHLDSISAVANQGQKFCARFLSIAEAA